MQKYQLCQAESHSSLLVARQGDVSRKLNQAFLLVDSLNLNFDDEIRSDIYSNTGLEFLFYVLHSSSNWLNSMSDFNWLYYTRNTKY